MNKKVLNATPLEYNGIQFKSKLEVAAYKALCEAGFTPAYEQQSYYLQETQSFPTLNYGPYKDRKLHKQVWGLNKYKIVSIKYTPDFTFNVGNTFIIIEIKGFSNYPYQKKLFFNWLKNNNPDSAFFEIHNQKQLKQAIQIIKQWNENLSTTSAGK